jgi:DNA-binding NarL/FixJ family response regulator
MMMSADGFSISKIAEELNISTKTVSTYRKRILDKMQFDNFIQVMQYAIENKL